MKVIDVINYLETRFPKSLALDFDLPRIGLEIGSSDVEVRNILLTLDLTMDVVDDAIKKGCNLIISHHPFIFDPLYKIEFDSNLGKILRKMFENNISLYAMHTNLDTGNINANIDTNINANTKAEINTNINTNIEPEINKKINLNVNENDDIAPKHKTSRPKAEIYISSYNFSNFHNSVYDPSSYIKKPRIRAISFPLRATCLRRFPDCSLAF